MVCVYGWDSIWVFYFFEFLVRVCQLRTTRDNEPFTILWAWHWHGILSAFFNCGHWAWCGHAYVLCFMLAMICAFL